MSIIKYFLIGNLFFSLFILSNPAGAQWEQCAGISSGGTIYSVAGGGIYKWAGTLTNGVYRSSNDGISWEQTSLNNVDVLSVFEIGNNVLAGTVGGIYKSTNYGESWNLTSLTTRSIHCFAAHDNFIFAGTTNGVVVSTDGGWNWSATTCFVNTSALAVIGNTIFAGASEGVYISTNNGILWSYSSLNVSVRALAAKGNMIFAATDDGVYNSDNLGASWTQTSLNNIDLACLSVSGDNIYAGSNLNGDVYISTNNGANWTHTSLTGTRIQSLYAFGDKIIAGTYRKGIFYSYNKGINWFEAAMDNQTVTSLAVKGNYIFAGTSSKGVCRSSDNGFTWSQTPVTNVNVVQIFANDNIIYATPGYFSTDFGSTWTQTGGPPQSPFAFTSIGNYIFSGAMYGTKYTTNYGYNWVTQSYFYYYTVYSLAAHGDRLFAGLWDHGVYYSADYGWNWVQSDLNNKTVYSLVVNGNNIYAGTEYNGVMISNNNGDNWYQSGLNYKTVISIAVSGSNIFAGTKDAGVYASTDNGITWSMKNQGFPSYLKINSLAIINDYLVAGTQYHSAWRRQISDIIGIQNISTEVPSSYSLSQNYPNPFNPSTTIKFAVPKSSNVKIAIYDLTGKEIEVLVTEHMQPGTYQTVWNASKYSSGIYFYKITSGSFTETKKMILIK